jgi:hypothetical protein
MALQRTGLAIGVLALAVSVASLGAQSRTDALAEAGWKAIEATDANRAAALFYEALTLDPRDPGLHLGAGVASRLQGRTRDAIASLARALDLEPRLTDASLILGELYFRQGDLDEAIRTYERALEHAPRERDLRLRLEQWRKEASVERSRTRWNAGPYSIAFVGQANEALATRALAVLDAGYERIGAALGRYPPKRVLVTLYTDEQFHDVLGAPHWSAGLFDGQIRMPVRGASQNLRSFDRILTHELAHAMISSLAASGVPAWVHEGLASLLEPRDPAAAARALRGMPPIPLSELEASFRRLSAAQATRAYTQSLVAAAVLTELAGTRMSIVLQELGRGRPFDAALERAGVRPADFHDALARRLR